MGTIRDKQSRPILLAGVPVATDDSTKGFLVGHIVLDTVANINYVNVDNTASAAVWEKISEVASVFGRTGDVIALFNDYDASLIDNDSTVPGVNVKEALDTLQAESGAIFPTVGSGATYATVKDAFDAMAFEIEFISDVTDTIDITVPANQNVIVNIPNGLTWTLSEMTVNCNGTTVFQAGMGGQITGIRTTGATSFNMVANSVLDITGINNLDISGMTSFSGFYVGATTSKVWVENMNILLGNTGNCGFDTPGLGSRMTDITVGGAGVSCSGFIANGREMIVANAIFSGTFDPAQANPLMSFTGFQPVILNNLIRAGTSNFPWISIGADESKISNIARSFNLDLTSSNTNWLVDSRFESLDMSDVACSNNTLSNVTVPSSISVGGNFNKANNMNIGGILFLNGDNNRFQFTRVSGNVIHAGTNNFLSDAEITFPTIGDGGTYATVKEAFDNSVFKIEFVSDVTDTTNIIIPANQDVFITIPNGFVWNMSMRVTISGTSIFKFGGNAAIVGTLTTGITLFTQSGTSLFDFSAIDRVDLSGMTGGSGFVESGGANARIVMHNTIMTLPNGSDCGFRGLGERTQLTGIEAIGGGVLCAGFVLGGQELLMTDMIFSGTFNTSSTDPLLDFSDATGIILDNFINVGNTPWIVVQGSNNKISNIHKNFNLELIIANSSVIADSTFDTINMNAATCDNNLLSNLFISSALLIAGDNNRGINIQAAAGVTFSGDNNTFEFTSTTPVVNTGLNNAISEFESRKVVNLQTGTGYTITITDGGNVITGNNAAAQTYTIPQTLNEGLPIGFTVQIVQRGAGQITFLPEGAEVITSVGGATKTVSQGAMAVLTRIDTTIWSLAGDITT